MKMSARAPVSRESSQPTGVSDRYSTPLKLVIGIATVVFAVEVIEPIFLPLLPPMSLRLLALLDGLVMTAVLAPLLYFLIVRRITDLLGYAQDEIAVSMRDFVDGLIWKSERDRFVAVLKEVSVAKEATVAHGTYGFVTAAGKRIELAFGVTVLDRTPTHQAKHLLLTAMPAAV
jgi:hypothetical protein